MAVALGNASLLGAGYLLLRRRGLAVLAVAVTVVLVCLLVSTADPAYEVAAGAWWAAAIAHGWFLARGEAARDGGRRTLQIGGGSCPAAITHYSGSSGPGPAMNRYVSASTSDVRSAFRPLVNR
ncbi:hypothetical protein [Streptomyces sp. PSAA01]|uniref:hypothetical protein n=1 Tax=Streptomyces sp. PSAA01 TaxID=2912762 RepID=UPI001F32E1DA|nr:hypothetical protein [Streptomyces sp. PSAA01]MCG0287058.1 hypothetical protein [Streptomyces sp. PSAA01]